MKSKIETKKFERTFVFEDCTVIWKYDTSAFSKILIDTLNEIAKN